MTATHARVEVPTADAKASSPALTALDGGLGVPAARPASHRAPRRHHLPNRTSLGHARAYLTAAPLRAARAEKKAAKPVRVRTPKPARRTLEIPVVTAHDTGKARFSVDKAGQASANVVRRSAAGYSTFAESTGSALAQTFEPNWIVSLFESEQQRRTRINFQAVAHVLLLTASAATKIASHRARKG